MFYCFIVKEKYMKFILKFSKTFLVFFLLFSFSISPIFAQWDNTDEFEGVAGFGDLEGLFQKVLGGIFSFGLIAVFVMLLYGGFRYLTAGGNAEANQKAGSVITYAVLGLVLMIGAWFILRLIEEFTGITITDFSIMFPG